MNDKHGNLRAILAGVKDLLRCKIFGIERDVRLLEELGLTVGDVILVYRRRRCEGCKCEKDCLFIPSNITFSSLKLLSISSFGFIISYSPLTIFPRFLYK